MKIKNLLLSTLLVCGFNSANLFGQAPVANFSIAPNPACIGQTVTLTDMSTNAPTSWTYTMIGGLPNTSILQNPSVTYTAAGTYTIGLIAKNGTGTSAQVVKTITISPTPTININPPGAQACFGASVSATFFGSGATTYTWSTGATTSTLAVFAPTTTTTYTLTGKGPTGCLALPKTATYTINPLPTVTVVANPTVICGPSTATMTAIAGGSAPFTYSWSPAGGTTSVAITPVPSTFSVAITDSKGCKTTGTITIVNGTIPTLSINPTSVTICQGTSASLTTTGTATSFTWNTGATTSSIAPSPSVTTTYTVTGYNGQCTRTATSTVNVLASTPITAVSSSSLICSGQSATLTASPTGTIPVLTYSWTTGTLGASTVVSPTTTTTYTVYAVNSNSCVSGNIVTQNVSACTGINGIAVQSSSFGLYPNPSNGDFTVTTPDSFENSTVEVYNGLGQLVSRNKVVNSITKINIANEANGVYHVRVMQDGKQVYRTKVLKN